MKYKHNADWYGTVSHRHSKEKFLDALIGGGISLLGGLFGKSDAEKRDKAAKEAAKVPVDTHSKTAHSVDLKGLVASAEASGFNPMTILNAGGLSAFTTTFNHTVTTGQNAMAAVPTAPSLGSVVAQAAGNAFSIYRDDKAAAAAASTAALSSFPPAPVASRGIMSVIGSTPGGYAAGGGRVASKTGALAAVAAPPLVKGGQTQWVRDPAKPGTTLNLPFLGDVTLSKRSPAQEVEDELGDLVAAGYGIGRIAESLDLNRFIGRPPTMADAVALGGRPKQPSAGTPWITVQGVIDAAKSVYSQYGTNRAAAVAGQTIGTMYRAPMKAGGW